MCLGDGWVGKGVSVTQKKTGRGRFKFARYAGKAVKKLMWEKVERERERKGNGCTSSNQNIR